MNVTRTVEVVYGSCTYEKEVTLGVLANPNYFVEIARQRVERTDAPTGRFRRGRVLR